MSLKPEQASNIVRTASGGFSTSDGTLYVSKPYRSKSSKKLRALITFAPRKSTFDINNERSGTNEFRGFFSLFWISIFLFTVRTYIQSIETSGRPLNLRFATMFSQDAITLAISDAVLVLTTGLCVPFAIALKMGWLRYHWTGIIIQHALQTSILFTAIIWTFNRKWPWVQSGFFTLHSLVMIMKMHSYMTVNGQLQYISKHHESVGGWESAIHDAEERKEMLDTATTRNGSASSDAGASAEEDTPSSTPSVPVGSASSYVDANTAVTLRKRLAAAASRPESTIKITQKASPIDGSNAGASVTYSEDEPARGSEPHILVNHPHLAVASLAHEYSDMRSELTSPGPLYITWPESISLKNFAVYQLTPTLVYELEYPRTDRIRPLYVFEKTVATFGTFVLLYSVTESFILPYTPTADQSVFRSLLDLALPFMMAYLLLFYIIFGKWNSTSWDEFSRKWNKPVHAFLLRHVYAATLASYKLSRGWAMFVTFLLSASVHELVMVIVTQKFRYIIQIPLILVGRIPAIKRNRLMGNVIFWLGLYAGFPLLCVAYVAY
ncbi:MBOAT, membrane-bound O-acyltransferase family-domain-containing protein [Cyathus striatus]|nr:MBOAT, membrane-bound O-acyltransferase family-domain-containing protein [Cyathus striatus]